MASKITKALKRAQQSQDLAAIAKKLGQGKVDEVVTEAADPLDIMGNLNEKLGNTKAQEAAAAKNQQDALNAFLDIAPPELTPIEYQTIVQPERYKALKQTASPLLQDFGDVSYEKISPEAVSSILQEKSALEALSLDPRYKTAADQSLSALNDIIAGGGMTAQERAQMAKVQADVNAQDRGRREAIMQNAQARGMGNSGVALLNQLQAAQDATSRQSQADLDIAAQAQARQLDAILKSGALAQNLGQQEYSQKSEAARAADAINQFNVNNQNEAARINAAARNQAQAQNVANAYQAGTGNRAAKMDTQRFNIGNVNAINAANTAAANTASQFNIGNQMQVGQQNANITNEQRRYNAGIPQQQYQNQMDRAAGLSGQYNRMAETEEQKAERLAAQRAQREAALIGAATTAAKAAAGGK